jgi:phage terminase small subunit
VLTKLEARFVQEFPIDGDATNAARRAGYAPKSAKVTGCRLLKKPEIRDALEGHRQAIEGQVAVVTAVAIADAVERRQVLSLVFRDKEMHPLARLKACDILNRMDGLYIQKIEDVTPPARKKAPVLRALSDDALSDLVAKSELTH